MQQGCSHCCARPVRTVPAPFHLFGNEVYISIRSDGSQLWGYVRNGVIQNGGINNPPIIFVPHVGLRR